MRSIVSPVLQKINPLRSEGVRQVLVYFMATIALFLLLLLADRILSGWAVRAHLYGILVLATLLGSLKAWLLEMPLYRNVPEWLKGMLTLTGNMVGAVFFMSATTNVSDPGYGQVILPALLIFSMPWFFAAAVRALMAIPALEYEPFQVHDLRDIVAEINWAENEDLGIVWEFENLPEMEADGPYWVRTHTPNGIMDMRLKDLFKGLLSLHNHNLNAGRPIHFKETRAVRQIAVNIGPERAISTAAIGQIEVPFGWRFFYQKDFFFWKMRVPLDPEKTLRKNGVRFRKLSDPEREEITNLRKGLSPYFRTTKIFIKRA